MNANIEEIFAKVFVLVCGIWLFNLLRDEESTEKYFSANNEFSIISYLVALFFCSLCWIVLIMPLNPIGNYIILLIIFGMTAIHYLIDWFPK